MAAISKTSLAMARMCEWAILPTLMVAGLTPAVSVVVVMAALAAVSVLTESPAAE